MENNNYQNKRGSTFSRWLFSMSCVALCLFASTNASAQFAVTTNGGSGLAGTYPSLAAAITALNGATITAPVVITCPTGTETSPAGGYNITAQGTATNTITINGNGAANSIITAPNPAGTSGALNDAIFKLTGADYVTISGFAMLENAANTTTTAASNNMVEFGVALFYATTSNGAQNNTITNNTIDLNRTYQNTFGIYANSTHTATAVTSSATAIAGGGNDGLVITSNSITDVNMGIVVVGPTAAANANVGLTIGGSGAGNTITNYGTTSTFSSYANVSGSINGILVRNVITANVSNNSITSSTAVTTGTLRGIYFVGASNTSTATYTNDINSNTLSIRAASTSGAILGIHVESAAASATSTLNINSNDFNTFGPTVASSGAITCIQHAANVGTLNINSNTFTNLSINTTGTSYLINNNCSTNNFTVSGNSVVTGYSKTGAGGTMYGYYNFGSPTGGTATITGNNFSNFTATGSAAVYVIRQYTSTSQIENITNNTIGTIAGGTGSVYGIDHGYGNTGSVVSGNTVSGITNGGTVYGIYLGESTASLGLTCNNNNVNTLSSTGASTVYGIYHGLGASTLIHSNKIYGLSASNASGGVSGLAIAGGTSVTAANNLIGDLTTPAANAANPLNGLNITGGTTVNAYNNTVYLNGSSSGALFGSSAISASTSPALTLRNNIFINLSTTAGAGLAVAYRRSSTTLTSYQAASNNNIFFTNSSYYTDGTNTDATFGAYQTRVSARDNASYSENCSFASTTGSSSTFLHFAPAATTLAESGGVTIATFTTDFDGDTRNATPDIGADEFAGTSPAPSITAVTITPTGNLCTAASRLVSGTVVPSAGTLTSVTLNYSLNGTPQTGIAMTNTTGDIWEATIPSSGNSLVTWSITAVNSIALSSTYSGGASYRDEPFTGFTATAVAAPTSVCNGSATVLTASVTQNGNVILGAGSTTSSSTAASFFPGSWGGAKTQYIVRASELTALGLTAGAITSIAFEPTTSGQTYQGFSVHVNSTANASMTTSFLPIGTQVYLATGANDEYTPTANAVNTLAFGTGTGSSSSFTWDGTSNLVITFNWSRIPAAATSTSSTMKVDPAGFTSSAYDQQDNVTPATLLASATADGTGTNRPRFTFAGVVSATIASWNWSDGVGSVGTTNPLSTVPTGTTTYTVTATDANGCTISASTAAVSVLTLPTAPTANDNTQCGPGVPTASVTSTTGAPTPQFRWYDAASGGTLLQSGTSATYTTSISSTTTFYVTEFDGTCESSPRTAVTQTVTAPPSVSIGGTLAICNGQSTTLTATSSNDPNYAYTWSTSETTAAITVSPTTATSYTVTAVDGGTGCNTSASVTVTVDVPLTAVSIAPSTSLICGTGSQTLVASGGTIGSSGSGKVGTGTSLSAASAEPTAFCNRWAQYWCQMVFTPAELNAAGIFAGNINSVAFDITTLGDNTNVTDFQIYMGPSAVSTLTAFTTSGLTQVFGPATYNHAVGNNVITFSTPYAWNGTSNVLLDIRQDGVDNLNNAITEYTATATNTCAYSRTSSTSPDLAGSSPSPLFSANRLNTTFTYSNVTNPTWSWSPNSDITASVSVSPVSTTTYTATATIGACTASGTATVTVVNATLSVTGSNDLCDGVTNTLTANPNGTASGYQWYESNNAIGGANSSTYVVTTPGSYSVSATIDGCSATSSAFVVAYTTNTITASAGTNGSISPSGAVVVNCGQNQTFTITPDPTYAIDDVLVDAVSQGAVGTYTFTNVTAAHTISASFIAAPCAVPPTATAGASTSVCDGAVYTLGGSIGGSATSATWSSSGTGIFDPSNVFGTATTYIPSPADITAGSVIITLTTDDPDAGGPCVAAVSTLTLTFGISPTTAATASCTTLLAGRTSLLDANATGAVSYQWSLNGTAIGAATSATYTTLAVVTAGTSVYDVVVTGTGGCTASSSVSVTNVTALPGGTYVIPGTACNEFPTIAEAVIYMNTYGIAGAVTFDVTAGHTEAANPLTNGIVMTATGTVTNTITFQKSGAGANPRVTAFGGGTATSASATPNGVWSLVGSDYVTIDGIDLQDNNTVNPAAMEFGYGLFKASATNGAQNNTIKNCVVTLNRVNVASGSGPMVEGSIGINVVNSTNTAATTSLTPTTVDGTNSNNQIRLNTVRNANYGVVINGFAASTPFTLGDAGNIINDNIIENFGGGASSTNPSAGIRVNNQWGVAIQGNTVNNNTGAGVNHPSTLRGIFAQAGTSANAAITGNIVTLTGGATTSIITGIDNGIGSTAASNTVDINTNTVTINSTTTTTGVITGIINSSTATTVNMNGNTLQNWTISGTGTNIGIESGSPETANVNNNLVNNITRTGISGSMRLIKTTSPTNFNAGNNTVDGATYSTVTSTGSYDGIYGLSSAVNVTITNNIVRNLSTPLTGTLIGIREFGSSAGTKTIANNQVYNFSTTAGGAGGATMSGIFCSTGNISMSSNDIHSLNSSGTTGGTGGVISGIQISGGTTHNIFKNKVYDLSSTSTGPSVWGIFLNGATTNNVYNNAIADLRATAASGTISIGGIHANAGTTNNIVFNSVHLNATSSGANFTTAAMNASTTPTVVLRNNIFVNNSTPNGTGYAAAYRRTSTTLTTYSNLSNNNLFYAGTPSATTPIFHDGTTPRNTLGDFQTLLAGVRDNSSVTENPAFISTSGASVDFLQITAGTSVAESGGVNITGITDDFASVIRAGNPGYLGTGTSPDIGAREFEGTNPVACTTVDAGVISTSPALPVTFCGPGSVTFSTSGINTAPGITYQWSSSAVSGGPYTSISGATSPAYVATVSSTAYYILTVTCAASSTSADAAEVLVTVNPVPTAVISPAGPVTFCSATPTVLTASTSATTPAYQWSLNGTTVSGATASTFTPLASGSYTVIVTENGCAFTSTAVAVTINVTPTTTASASSNNLCGPGTIDLNATTAVLPSAVTTYSFAASTATYVPLSGGTASTAVGDDVFEASVPIGFTFMYNGSPFTTFGITSNGAIQMGSVAASQITNTLATVANIIGPMWEDDNSTNGVISYLTTGTAPNRVCTVDYFNMSIGGSGSTANPVCNFQIRMHENGTIEFHYGNLVANTLSASIGITGAVGSYISVTPAVTPTTSSATPNNSINSVVDIPTGTLYTFTPPSATYSWTSDPAGFTSSTQNNTGVAVSGTTTYTVVVSSGAGCTSSSSVLVTVAAPLVVTIPTDVYVCTGQTSSVAATAVGGGLPYTYQWYDVTATPVAGQTSATLSIVMSGTADEAYYVEVSDACGNLETSGFVTLHDQPYPTVAVSPSTSGICVTGSSTLTASGATTYSWTPAGSLNVATGATVIASPTANTVYTVTGTTNGCSSTATATVNYGTPIIDALATATPPSVCAGGTTQLEGSGVSFYPYQAIKITEVTLYSTGTGQTPTYPTHIGTGDADYVELTNISSTSVDISGFTFADYSSNSATATHPYTFASGTIVPAGGVVVVKMGTGTDSPSNLFFCTGGTTSYSSGGLVGIVIKSGSIVADAVGLNSGYVFNAGTGVTATDWTGFASSPSGAAGTVRTAALDNNAGSDWVASTVTAQSIGTNNGGFTPLSGGTITYSWSPSASLDDPNIATPIATPPTGTTVYTVTMTNPGGCTATATVSVDAGTLPTVTLGGADVCTGGSTTLTATVLGGGAPYTYEFGDGVGFTPPQAGNTFAITPSGTTAYSVIVTDACGNTATASHTINVNPYPTVAASSTAPGFCVSGSVDLSATGATTYAWSPATGLSGTTGTPVTASPAATTTYTVTGTSLGCSSTATVTVNVGAAITSLTATATPASICAGGTSQLLAVGTSPVPAATNQYGFTASTGTYTPLVGGTNSTATGDDGTQTSIPIGFTFPYNNTTFTTFGISTNGTIQLGTTATSFGNSLATITNVIAPMWDDNNRATGAISYLMTGTAPNRVLTVEWNNIAIGGTGSTTDPTNNFQLQLYEGGMIQFNYGSLNTSNTLTASIGISGNPATSFISVTPGAPATSSTVAANNAIGSVVDIPTGTIYTFTPPSATINYSWSPTTDLDNPLIANPISTPTASSTTYTVTASNLGGCTASATVTLLAGVPPTVVLNAAPLNVCSGGTTTLTATVTGGGAPYTYEFGDGVGFTPPQAGNSYTLTPSAATTYTVIVTDACGATATATVDVTVGANPTVTASGSAGGYCNTGTVTLTAGGADTYVWSPATALSATTGTSVDASPTTTTTYTVVGTNSAGCTASATVTVTVSTVAPPSPTVTGYSICTGASIPTGEGLVANCGTVTTTTVTSAFGGAPFTVIGSYPLVTSVVSTLTVPALPAGAVVQSAVLRMTGVSALAPYSWLSDINIGLSGDYILGPGTISTTSGSGNFAPFDIPLTGYSQTSAATFNLILGDFYNDNGTGDLAVFSSEIIITYTISSSSLNWFTTSTGGTSISTDPTLDPIGLAGSGLADSNTPGDYIFYAECSNGFCTSPRVPVTLSIGQTLSVAAASDVISTCTGATVALSSTVTGGGQPYTYSWSDGATVIGTTASLNTVITGNTTYTVTVTDDCGATATSSVSVTTLPSPTVSVSPTSTAFCSVPAGGSAVLTASGAVSYEWSPASSLNNTTINPVTATPTTTTIYTVVGTAANGCTASATSTVTVGLPINVSATATPTNICSGATSQLQATGASVGSALLFTEVVLFRTGTGATPTYPAAITGADLVEITNISTGSVDVSGYQFFDYSSGLTTANHAYTFLPGTIIPAGGVLTLNLGTGTDSPVDLYFNTGGTNDSYSSGTNLGAVLKSGSQIIDVVATNSYSFNAGTGVTAAMWTTNAPSASGFAGTRRVVSIDNNVGGDWLQSNTTTNVMNVGTNNGGFVTPAVPSFTYSWSPATDLSSTTISNPVAGPLTGPATVSYTVTVTEAGGCTSTATTTINVGQPLAVTASASRTAQYCQNGTATNTLTAAIAGGGSPYTYSWSNGSTTNPTTVTSPVGINTYTVTVTDACGNTATASVNDTANVVPVVTVSGNAPVCGSGSLTLTASGATTYAWSPATGLNSTNTATVISTPSASTTYTVVGTIGTCTASTTVPVILYPATTVTASADLTTGCSPLSTTLHAVSNASPAPSLYSFSGSAGTFTPITGTSVTLGSQDDGYTGNLPIGFPFSYNGTTSSVFAVSPNGWLEIGQTGSATSGFFANALNTVASKISPFWDDNNMTGGTIQYLTVGNTLTVQWLGMHVAGIGSTTNPTIDMQVILNGTTGEIKFVYGPTSAALSAPTASIGLSGAVGNFISVTPATPASSSTASIVTANNSIASATDIPSGTTYTFTPPANTLSWSPSTALSSTTDANPTVTNLTTTTTYTVTATGAGGCTGTATVTLTVQPTVADPTVTASPSGTVCPGSSVLLDAGAGYTNYLWSNGATTQTTTVTPSATTTYTVIVDNGPSSCSASGSITVNTFTVATASIVDPGPFCTPGSATLSVTPSFSSYLWSTTATTPTISISTGGLYSVTVTDANGCSQTASFTAVSNPFPPTAVITSSGGYSLCWDGVTPASITLTADITGADPGSTIQWFDENFSTTPSITLTSTSTDFVNISNPLVLLFNVTSPAGCVTTSNVVSVANDITPIITSLSATTGCNGDVITITGSAFTGELFTGPSAILFNGTPAPSFTFVDDNTITVTVPAGATTGPITVVSGAGNCTAVSGTFTVACGSPMTINLTAYLQGYYLGAGTMQPVLANQFVPGATGAETDTITVEIYDASTFLLAGSAKAVLMTDGSATAVVYGSDGQYYIAIRHRNSILTWSSVDIALATATPASYDFSSSLANVFSGWMADDFSEGIYSIFTGDINQDEFVDAADFPDYDNDNAAGACCDYYVTDLNGDGFVDAADFPSYDNNNSAGVFSIHP